MNILNTPQIFLISFITLFCYPIHLITHPTPHFQATNILFSITTDYFAFSRLYFYVYGIIQYVVVWAWLLSLRISIYSITPSDYRALFHYMDTTVYTFIYEWIFGLFPVCLILQIKLLKTFAYKFCCGCMLPLLLMCGMWNRMSIPSGRWMLNV